MNIIFATRNPSKAEQTRAVFADTQIFIQTMDEAGIEGEAAESRDAAATLQDNASTKAQYAHKHAGAPSWTMADDTGIFIDALGGNPGVQAAYWGGEELSTEGRMRYCLQQLAGIEDRRATFRTVVALIAPGGQEYSFTGEARGRILVAPATDPQPKMPYSPIFVPDDDKAGRSWAEMTIQEENALSHRGKAFRQVVAFLNQLH